MCLFQTSIGFWRERGVYVGCIRSQQKTPYRRLHCQSYASSIVVTRRPLKLQVRSRRARAVPRTKGKEFFSRVTQWWWRSCEPPNDNRSHKPCALRTLPVLCLVDRRDSEAAELQLRSRRALAIPLPFPEQKEKNSFHECHNGDGVRANLKTTKSQTLWFA